MSDSTSILDLPTDPLELKPGNLTLDQTTISQIVNGLQQATLTGSTQLSSRDIPMTTINHSNDPQTQPNYVPSPPQQNVDYIQNFEVIEPNERTNSLDDMYNELQTPLLLAILYFLFQLPFFRKFLFGYFPILFSNDGNFNINGFIFTSSLYGIIFYVLNKITTHFGKF
jgi:hypothetical protein